MNSPNPSAGLAALLARAEQAVTVQGDAYGSEQDPDAAVLAAWNTWRALQALVAAVRPLVDQPSPAPHEVRRLAVVRQAA